MAPRHKEAEYPLMAKQVSHEEVFTRFIEDFRTDEDVLKYEQAIQEMPIKGFKSLTVDFNDLYNYDMELAADVMKDPDRLLDLFSRVVFDKLRQRDLVYAEAQKKIHVRVRALPSLTPLRKIGSEHIGRLVMIKGIIVRATATTPTAICPAAWASFPRAKRWPAACAKPVCAKSICTP